MKGLYNQVYSVYLLTKIQQSTTYKSRGLWVRLLSKVTETYGSMFGKPLARFWLDGLVLTSRFYKESISPASHMVNQSVLGESVLKQRDDWLCLE